MAKTSTYKPFQIFYRIHQFDHATEDDMRHMPSNTNQDQTKVSVTCDKFHAACPICNAAGRTVVGTKITTTHFIEGLKEDIQVDIMHAKIHGKRYELLNIVDMGTFHR